MSNCDIGLDMVLIPNKVIQMATGGFFTLPAFFKCAIKFYWLQLSCGITSIMIMEQMQVKNPTV